MKQAYIAVIDCGTNTFSMSIYNYGIEESSIKKLSYYVNLGLNGIEKLSDESIQKGLQAFLSFKKELNRYENCTVRAVGTAALRQANNALGFINLIYKHTGIQIEIISGKEEAKLIYYGVYMDIPKNTPALIIDIGGGSVEFILVSQQELMWYNSYPIGNAVLYHKFHKFDPINKQNIQQLNDFLEDELVDLVKQLQQFPSIQLISSSGSLNFILHMMSGRGYKNKAVAFDMLKFEAIKDRILPADIKIRQNIPQLPKMRAKYSVVTLLLIQFLLTKINIHYLIRCNKGIKEGLLAQTLSLSK